MSNNTLSISRLIKVSVSLAASAAQSQNINSMLILGTSTVIDTVSRIRSYTTIEEVAADFGTAVEEYLQAFLWFEQVPQPSTLSIGRWANTAAAGQLLGAPLTAAQQALSNFTSITTGSMTISVDGVAQNLTAVSFSGVLNLNGVATAINGKLTGATAVWNANQSRFVITSSTTGASSAVSFATAEGTGVDVSTLLGLRATNSGSYVAPGIVAETALAAVTLFDSDYGQQWFGLVVPAAVDADNLAIGPFIEASANFHYFGWSTVETGVITAGSSDIASEMSALKLNRSGGQYSSTNPYTAASLLARILTTDYTANNSTITLMYKQEPGIVAENLSSSQLNTLESKNCNVFVAYDNNTAIIEPGVSSSGVYIDSVIGSMVFGIALQTALFNALYTTTTKIPQTDAGMSMLAAVIEQVILCRRDTTSTHRRSVRRTPRPELLACRCLSSLLLNLPGLFRPSIFK
jgi:hypothetical protein